MCPCFYLVFGTRFCFAHPELCRQLECEGHQEECAHLHQLPHKHWDAKYRTCWSFSGWHPRFLAQWLALLAGCSAVPQNLEPMGLFFRARFLFSKCFQAWVHLCCWRAGIFEFTFVPFFSNTIFNQSSNIHSAVKHSAYMLTLLLLTIFVYTIFFTRW